MMKLYNLKRNFIIWTVMSIVCAAPSFFIALKNYDVSAMITGVVIVIAGYTLVTSTPFIHKIREQKRILYRSLKIGFGLKVLMVLVGLIGGVLHIRSFEIGMFPDLLMGAFAAESVKNVFGFSSSAMHDYFPTLLTTLTEAVFMSIVILIVVLLVWAVQRIYIKLFKGGVNA